MAYGTVKKYEQKVNNLFGSLYKSLEASKKSYVLYEVNKNLKLNNNTALKYINDKDNIEDLKIKIFLNLRDMENESEMINEQIVTLNKKINNINKKINSSSNTVNKYEDNNNAAVAALKDRTTRYNELYIQNVILLILIIIHISLYVIRNK
jgi:hypothetical protein